MQTVAYDVLQAQRPSHHLVGSETKNPLPTNSKWSDIAGLSWIFLDDDFDSLKTTNIIIK